MWFRNRKLNKLKRAKIAGLITPDEEEVLNKMLDASDKEREAFLRLLDIENKLNSQLQTQESIDVSGSVMQKIVNGSQRNSTVSPLQNPFGGLYRPAPVRFAFIMTVGILIGFTFSWIFFAESSKPNTELLSGSMVASPKQGLSYVNNQAMITMVPYQIGQLNYLNFMIDAKNEVLLEVTFDESDFLLKTADYISADGARSSSFDPGSVYFTASGITTFQIVLEKKQDQQKAINIKASQNQSVLTMKQLFLEK